MEREGAVFQLFRQYRKERNNSNGRGSPERPQAQASGEDHKTQKAEGTCPQSKWTVRVGRANKEGRTQ